ncbi:MAG: Pvc16 family protein, partial [Bacteroidota bacterium]
PSNSPALPKGVNRLVFEMESLDLHQLNHIWGAIGTKYLPSSVYRLKMLTINDHAIRGLVPSVESISSGVNQNGQ